MIENFCLREMEKLVVMIIPHTKWAVLAATTLLTLCHVGLAVQPNFVFFITDDISADDLGIYGNSWIHTPNLDRLATQGLVFDNAYLTISSCSPSRCSMITGRYPHNTGAPELHTTLPDDQVTFVQLLKNHGYHTILSGKNHMNAPEKLGFVEHSDSSPSGSENWVRHLRERPRDKPFFCWFASHDAHYAFTPDSHAPTYNAIDVQVPPMLFDGPATRQELAEFAHEVSRTDYYAGQVMDELERQGVRNNTYFIYCSDNGRPFPRCKTYLFDSGIRTPLIVLGPRVSAGRTKSITSSVDYAATILELAGVEKPPSVQGVSFVPVLEDPTAEVRNVAFSERNWHVYQNHARAVRHDGWLYIWNAWPERYNVSSESSDFKFAAAKELWLASAAGKLTDAQNLMTQPNQPSEMLFRIADDPHQLNNMAAETRYQDVMKTMRELLGAWQSETGDDVPESPTLDRQPLHEGNNKPVVRGAFPGARSHSTANSNSGPVIHSNSP
ncbi:MAG: sulfatase [Planctomycetales bacterium]|nr:sulfatase [Planctomycetales bacterium]